MSPVVCSLKQHGNTTFYQFVKGLPSLKSTQIYKSRSYRLKSIDDAVIEVLAQKVHKNRWHFVTNASWDNKWLTIRYIEEVRER